MRAFYILAGWLLAWQLAFCQSAADDGSGAVRISGPLLGYLLDPAEASLRPVWGVPGAATLGAPVALSVRWARAAVAPTHDYLLAQVEGEPDLALLSLEAAPAAPQRIPGALENPDRMVFSPAGTAAVLHRSSDGTIQVLAGLPREPVLAGRFTIPGDAGALTALAVSDDARAVLAALAGGETALFTAEGRSRRVGLPGAASALAFFRGSHDAVIASRAERTVYLLRDAGGADEITALAREGDGVDDPVAVETSWDGRRVLVANAASLLVVDLAGGVLWPIPSPSRITGLHRLAGNAVFRLEEPGAGPLAVLDADASEPRVVFVPAVAR